jgi:pimeloyl-ACP methyl ester carboxylesterase
MASTLQRLCMIVGSLAATCGLGNPAGIADEPIESRVLSTARTMAAEVADHSLRGWFRERVRDADDGRYGLQLDDNWRAMAAEHPALPLVVMIHGFNSSPARNAAILEPIRAAGFPVAVFAYPNDSDIAESAALLSHSLENLAAAHPEMRVAIVSHSMGGLVARACVEDAALDPGNVVRLVMIAPPTHGSYLAHMSFGTDLWEHWLARRHGSMWRRWRDSVNDGLGEASDELVPGSPFLVQLNARPRNPRIRYAIFLGDHAPIKEYQVNALRWAVRRTGRIERLEPMTDSTDRVLADMEELVDGKGDGVVAVKRGRLAGVDDVVVLPVDHFSCTDQVGSRSDDAVQQIHTELLARLR